MKVRWRSTEWIEESRTHDHIDQPSQWGVALSDGTADPDASMILVLDFKMASGS
jgi:hypothetical protein